MNRMWLSCCMIISISFFGSSSLCMDDDTNNHLSLRGVLKGHRSDQIGRQESTRRPMQWLTRYHAERTLWNQWAYDNLDGYQKSELEVPIRGSRGDSLSSIIDLRKEWKKLHDVCARAIMAADVQQKIYVAERSKLDLWDMVPMRERVIIQRIMERKNPRIQQTFTLSNDAYWAFLFAKSQLRNKRINYGQVIAVNAPFAVGEEERQAQELLLLQKKTEIRQAERKIRMERFKCGSKYKEGQLKREQNRVFQRNQKSLKWTGR